MPAPGEWGSACGSWCACGCGRPTPIATRTFVKRGQYKGKPLRYVRGHTSRKGKAKKYPELTVNGRSTRIHRIRAEKALGRPLPSGAHVHHPDEDKPNPHARLVICQDLAYHKLLHYRADILRAGGNPNTDRWCVTCHRTRPATAFYTRKSGIGAHTYLSQCIPCIKSRREQQRA